MKHGPMPFLSEKKDGYDVIYQVSECLLYFSCIQDLIEV